MKIKKELEIMVSPEKAFDMFLSQLNAWWPKEYTWSQDKLEKIWIDGKKDGLCTEIGPHGFRCDWGRVIEIMENKKVQLKWQISPKREPVPDPEKASDITIEFKNHRDGTTTLHFEHFNFEHHGAGYEEYAKMMDSEHGWDYILNKFREYCEA